MHPIVFNLPLINMPLRFFGLFIVDAFFFATLWLQWHYLAGRNPAFAARWKGFHPARAMVVFAVLARVLFLAAPLPWGIRLGGIFLTDVALMVFVRVKMGKAMDVEAKKDAEFVFSLTFWLLIVGFLGARLFWIVTTPTGQKDFGDRPIHALFAIWQGGIVYYGGLLCAAAFGAWYLWVKKGKGILEFGDLVMIAIALTLFIGRWACFSAGCDYGKPTEKAWGLIYEPVPGGIDRDSLIPYEEQGRTHLHPSQLYMSLNGLAIFLILALVYRKRQFHGQIVWLFLMLYAVGRSFIEFYRGDEGRGVYEVAGRMLSSSQIISVPVFIVAAICYFVGWRRHKVAEANLSAPEE